MLKLKRIYNYKNGVADQEDPTTKLETQMLTMLDYVKILTCPFYLNNRCYKVVPVIRYARPCRKCLLLTHSAKYCSKPQRCMNCTEAHHQLECKTNVSKCIHCFQSHASDDEHCQYIQQKTFSLNEYLLKLLTGENIIQSKFQILKNKNLTREPQLVATNMATNLNLANQVHSIINSELTEISGRASQSEDNIGRLNHKIDIVNENLIMVNSGYIDMAKGLAAMLKANNDLLLQDVEKKVKALFESKI